MSLTFNESILIATLVILGASVFLLLETLRLPTSPYREVGRLLPRFRKKLVRLAASLFSTFQKPDNLVGEALKSMKDTSPAIEVAENYNDFDKYPNSETLVVLLGCLSAPREVKDLGTKDYLAGRWFYSLDPDPRLKTKLERICFKHFVIWQDNKIVGFRYSAAKPEQPNAQSMDAITRVLSPWKASIAYWNLVVEASFEAIHSEFYDRSRQLFKLKSSDNGSVFGTFAVMSTIRTLLPSLSADQLATLSPLVEEVSKTLKDDPSLWERKDGIFGYLYQDRSEPCLSKTEYVYRIAVFQREFFKKLLNQKKVNTPLFNHIAQNSRGMLNLIKECQEENGAGFARSISQKKQPTTTHSRYTLQLLRGMLNDGLIGQNDLVEWFDPVKILAFLIECECNHGFADRPAKRKIPSLFGSRAGANIIKLLEIARLNGIFPDSKEYSYSLSKITAMNPELAMLVEECYDRELDAYWAFPTKYIRAKG